ncbi:putative glucose-6-phosphate 1-epimerase [Gracilariopsis chorda]|uniref:glucose-6-phosphate 1-epimerase n=1 Tax=Gracilariopsis chorda TaxID=448386 RepID=A0A2V3IV49_9FLOR|nr:putative glucose-6-phosphate 1-epimerase [Gracilariopsis chorda]|eukprot:PXF46002.1 putative glucose-6-phosphate 1-epimerase [Gracilariopsis chorda]
MKKDTITASGQSSVTVYDFGAHVTSWKNASGKEILYTSPSAKLDGSKAIRGGIPICFPQFGKKGPLRQHGFARNSFWTPDESFGSTEDGPALKYTLRDTGETRQSAWPHSFEAAYFVTLAPDGNSLTVELQVKNTNKNGEEFSFTTALHSYFCCNSQETTLSEYSGLKYEDNIESGVEKTQHGIIEFGKEVDRVYLGTKSTLSLPSANLVIEKVNMPDAVVWNPYIEKTAALSDMPDDDWKKFICIEPGRIGEPAFVKPGETWTCSLTLLSTS